MEVRPGYKQTEVGVIPEDWEALPARDIGAFKGGSGFPLTAQGETSGAYPFFKVSDMNNEGNETFMTDANHYISEETRKRLGATVFPRDSIVFAKVGAAVFLERKKILIYPSCIDNNMAAFVLDKTYADVRYVHSLLLSKKLGALVATTALPALNNKQLGEMKLALPPLPEQRAIATALSDVDALLGGLDRLIAKKRDLKQAAMQQLLTGQTRLPGFHGEWEVKRLDQLGEIRSGGTPSTSQARFWDGEVLWCTPTDITALQGHKYLHETSRTISAAGLKSSSAEIIPSHSLIMTSRATIGECAINLVPMTTNQGFKNIVPYEEVDIEFLYYLMSTQKGRLIALCAGSTFLEVGKKQLSSFEVFIPTDLNEQSAIAVALSDMDAELTALEAQRDKTRALKQAMMQELLTGKTRLVKPEAAHA